MAMNLRLTEDEAETLRAQADVEGRSQNDVARAAIREYVARHRHLARVDALVEELYPENENLLRRLGEA
jgi:predicted transcriptional regulator